MKIAEYKEAMEQDGWVFKTMYSEQCIDKLFGKKDGYQCYINYKNPEAVATTDNVFFWEIGLDWEIEAPTKYSWTELMINSFQCDMCGLIQKSTDNLVYVNHTEKWCNDCCKVLGGMNV